MPQQANANAAASRNLGGFAALVADAQQGDVVALGLILDAFRPYLLTIANQQMPDGLQGKCGGSDLVQETLLEAHRGFSGFIGDRPDELRVWLRGILHHNLKDWVRRFRASAKRSVSRENSLQGGTESNAVFRVVDPGPTPGTCACHREESDSLDRALQSLAEDERAVIILRNRDHLSWEDVGRVLDRSPDASRMLWKRAILRLQKILDP